MKNVILIGDSIRMGYQPFVAAELEGTATVWGPEQNGGTSRNVLENLEEWVLSRPEEVVHLNCGLHDIARDPDENGAISGTRVSLEEYEGNVREILSRIQATGKTILWAATTPVNQADHSARKGFERYEADVDAYNCAAARVAAELNIRVDDLFAVVKGLGQSEVLLNDGVHYNEDGSKGLGKAVAAFLKSYL